ncbi:MAG: DUF4012 domain-containing protein [Patescibacteria group bacterium]|nr:DUF4012 domain-containing protein [Patescibacteria group bacterium]
MPRDEKKPQLRVCSVCKKPGHNKSRCPEFFSSLKTASPAIQPIKFIIHENSAPEHSPYLINLKKPTGEFWHKIETSAPTKNSTYYHSYHQQKSAPPAEAATEPLVEEPAVEEPIALETLIKETPPVKKESVLEVETKAATKTKEKKIKNQPIFWQQIAWRTALVVLILVIPFKASSYYQSLKNTTGQIAANGTEGFMALQESTAAIMQADIPGAENSVVNALGKFNNAVNTMNNNHRLLQKIVSTVPIVSKEVQGRQKLITAGQKIALGNTYLIKGLGASQKNASTTLTARIKIITEHLRAATPNYEAALADLSAVNAGILPVEYQASFKDFKILFTALLNDLKNLSDLGTAVEEIFGGKGLRRYLVVFQNPHEIRPTGGFLGSFALLDIKDGKIVHMEIPAGGAYDLQGQLDQFVEPPAPLLLSNKRWEFQDANWFPDFPASAEKMLWFYRHSRQITADGVIAVNASVLERLLAVFGPIIDEKRGLTLAADNAVATIQKVVEEGPEKEANKPKQILSDLAPQFLSYLDGVTPEQIMPLLVNLSESLEQKEIQAYFTDTDSEETVKSFGWSGQLLPTTANQDYLMVVNANIQGQKSDAEIKQTISHQAIVQDDGSVIDTVVITRSHAGTPGEKLYGQTNIDYIRVYTPLGSELISAGGFVWPDERKFRAPDSWTTKDVWLNQMEKEIGFDERTGTRLTEEFGKTVFGNWLILEPGETRQIQFTYRLPGKVFAPTAPTEKNIFNELVKEDYQTSRFQLIAQRQSGQESSFESQIIYPALWHPSWNEGAEMTLASNGAGIGAHDLTGDTVWSLVMKKEKN